MSNDIKNNFYSRQIGTYGIETMKKIGDLKILIYGMRGLGAEIAKNLILMGVKEVSLYDEQIVKINDLSSNFCLQNDDVNKKRRDISSLSYLKKLNSFVDVNIPEISTFSDLYSLIPKYEIVIITEIIKSSSIIKIEEICRNNNHAFIYSGVLGLFSFIFNDFGKKHLINNWNGNTSNYYYIKNISNSKECLIEIDNSNDILLPNEEEYVIFKEIEGMDELNDGKPRKIKNIISKNSFTIEEDTTNFGKYIKNGICIEKKITKEISFSTFHDNLINPVIDENLESENISTIHSLIYSIHQFFDKNNFLPSLNSDKDSTNIYYNAKNFYEEKKNLIQLFKEDNNEFNEELALNLSKFISAEISPYTTFIGGIVSQEIVKFSGIYTPINQLFYYEAYDTIKNLKDINRTLLNSRYDDQIAIYGQEIQEKLSKSNVFMVGAGALGCEYLKILAMIGISTHKDCKVTVTDNDSIEMSNLNRQFLFHIDDIGKSKSECACSSVKLLNKEMNCEAHKNLASLETEKIYDENFFNNQTFLISAVDNNKARKYIDSQAILFKKPLLDAGTEGTKANTQLVIPDLTQTISDVRNEESSNKNAYTSCTLKFFPSLIEHCIEFGKAQFDNFFVTNIQNIIDFISEPDSLYKKIKELTSNVKISFLNEIKEYLILLNSNNYEKCLELGFKIFYYNFKYRIEELLKINPIDTKNPDGSFFWSGSKRIPSIINFDIKDKFCREFIISFANLISKCFNIEIKHDINDDLISSINERLNSNISGLNNELEQLNIENDNDDIEQTNLNEENKFDSEQYKETKISNLLNEIETLLKNVDNNKQKITPEIFDKDDDSNGQIDFIYYFSNLRARNYKIQECDKLKVKFISGKIIPAIESTTAAVTGFNTSQIFSLLINKTIEDFTEIQMDLGTSFFAFHSPYPKKINTSYVKSKKKYIAIPNNWSIWDPIIIEKSMTLKEFIDYFYNKYKIIIRGIYNQDKNLMKRQLINEKIEDIYCKVKNTKKDSIRHIITLSLDSKDDNKNIIISPQIIYKFQI